MKLYHASLNVGTLLKYHKLFPDRKLNVLRSFGMLGSEDHAFCVKYRSKVNSLILDSGTFTLNYAKPEASSFITLNNYKNYVQTFKKYYDFYFNFDADFSDDGFETNLYNQKYLESFKLSPTPVIHDIWGPEIDYYIDRKDKYQRVALGSAQIKTEETLDYVMERFEGTGIKIHLFGNTTFEFLVNYPIASVDTAMWARMGGYGFIKYWNPKKDGKDKTDKIYLEEFIDPKGEKKVTYSNYEFRKDLDEFMSKTLNVTYQGLMGVGGADNKMLVNTHYYAQLEDIVNQIHQEKGFNTMGDAGG